jgi:hypothetical protein
MELRRPRRGMVGDRLRVLQQALVLEIRGDSRRPKRKRRGAGT